MAKTSLNEYYASILPINTIDIPDNVLQVIEELGLKLKDEFHVTLIGFGIWKVIKEQEESAIGQIESFIASQDFNITLKPKYSLLQEHCDEKLNDGAIIPQHIRKTIIQDVEIPELPNLYIHLNQLLNSRFETPYLHITLASRSDYRPYMQRGIGLYSKQDYDTYLVKVII